MATGRSPVPRERLGSRAPSRACPRYGGGRARFFGRRPKSSALERIRRQKLLVVIGPSGVGKTSFVRAGPSRRAPRTGGPGRHAESSAFAALAQVSRELLADAESLDELLGRLRTRLPRCSGRIAVATETRRSSPRRDQFKELLTQTPQESQERFARLLGAIAGDRDVCIVCRCATTSFQVSRPRYAPALLRRDGAPTNPVAWALLRAVRSRPEGGIRLRGRGLAEEMVQAVVTERGPCRYWPLPFRGSGRSATASEAPHPRGLSRDRRRRGRARAARGGDAGHVGPSRKGSCANLPQLDDRTGHAGFARPGGAALRISRSGCGGAGSGPARGRASLTS